MIKPAPARSIPAKIATLSTKRGSLSTDFRRRRRRVAVRLMKDLFHLMHLESIETTRRNKVYAQKT